MRPDILVATAERCGLIGAADLQVLEKVCRFIHDCRPQDHGLKYVEINISVGEMLGANLARDYTDMLHRYGVPVEMISIEFLETLRNDDSEVFQQAKKSLLDAGFAFSLDDFGTEFSNMGRLFNNNFTNIKIDKSLLWDADKDPNSRELLASLTKMIEKMHFVPLQEGVETKAQLTFVTQHDCRLIQGYYFSKALPAPEFMNYLTSFQGVQTAG